MPISAFHFDRRHFIASLVASVGTVALAGCITSGPPRLAIVLIDVTDSVTRRDWAAYQMTAASLVDSIRASQVEAERERLIVATIDSRPFSRFERVMDVTIAATGLVDDTVHVPAQRDDIKAQLGLIVPQAQSSATRIFDALTGAADIIANNPGYAPQILLLSDMVEESPILNLKHRTLDDAGIADLLDHLREQGLLPDLHQAAVHVSGGAGEDAAAYATTKRVWEAYFARANAQLQRYSRSPLTFPSAA